MEEVINVVPTTVIAQMNDNLLKPIKEEKVLMDSLRTSSRFIGRFVEKKLPCQYSGYSRGRMI
jgi:hypothetical protein